MQASMTASFTSSILSWLMPIERATAEAFSQTRSSISGAIWNVTTTSLSTAGFMAGVAGGASARIRRKRPTQGSAGMRLPADRQAGCGGRRGVEADGLERTGKELLRGEHRQVAATGSDRAAPDRPR